MLHAPSTPSILLNVSCSATPLLRGRPASASVSLRARAGTVTAEQQRAEPQHFPHYAMTKQQLLSGGAAAAATAGAGEEVAAVALLWFANDISCASWRCLFKNQFHRRMQSLHSPAFASSLAPICSTSEAAGSAASCLLFIFLSGCDNDNASYAPCTHGESQ